jgi:hypothetical protein
VASIESPFIRPSLTLRTKTTRRTIWDLPDQPALSRPSFLLLWLQKHSTFFQHRQFIQKNWTWRTRREELVPYLSFPQSSAASASYEFGFVKKINARDNTWRPRFRRNTRSSGFFTSQDKDTAAPFDHADRRYVVDGIRVVLSFRLHQLEDHFEQLAMCVLEEWKSAISLWRRDKASSKIVFGTYE